ncbi:MAG: hypothetical protein V4706_02735 [Pseudomonadota bacterium]
MSIVIQEVPTGVGVQVHTDATDMVEATRQELNSWAELSEAINQHMRSCGATGFDCLKQFRNASAEGMH